MSAGPDTEYRCKACDVGWARSEGRTCWCCGGVGDPMTASRAHLWRRNEEDVPSRAVVVTTPARDAGACEECGNDDPCEGYRYCSDCLELLGHGAT